MNAYIWQADIYCEECAEEACRALSGTGHSDTGDSGDYPQGPYSSGGGEADTPQHCGGCREFLGNPLTSDGYAYVADRIRQYLSDGRGSRDVLRQWSDFYRLEDDGLDAAIKLWRRRKPRDWL